MLCLGNKAVFEKVEASSPVVPAKVYTMPCPSPSPCSSAALLETVSPSPAQFAQAGTQQDLPLVPPQPTLSPLGVCPLQLGMWPCWGGCEVSII